MNDLREQVVLFFNKLINETDSMEEVRDLSNQVINELQYHTQTRVRQIINIEKDR